MISDQGRGEIHSLAQLVTALRPEGDQQADIRAAYDALKEEFALVGALIKVRADANMAQEQVARAMGTTQAAIARLESGRSSTKTLER